MSIKTATLSSIAVVSLITASSVAAAERPAPAKIERVGSSKDVDRASEAVEKKRMMAGGTSTLFVIATLAAVLAVAAVVSAGNGSSPS